MAYFYRPDGITLSNSMSQHSTFYKDFESCIVNSSEHILLPNGTSKYTYHKVLLPPSETTGSGPAYAEIIVFNREDHTLANLLVGQLRKDSNLSYVAYKISHPHDHSFELRLHVSPNAPKGYSGKIALVEAAKSLFKDLQNLSNNITMEFALHNVGNTGVDDQKEKDFIPDKRNVHPQDLAMPCKMGRTVLPPKEALTDAWYQYRANRAVRPSTLNPAKRGLFRPDSDNSLNTTGGLVFNVDEHGKEIIRPHEDLLAMMKEKFTSMPKKADGNNDNMANKNMGAQNYEDDEKGMDEELSDITNGNLMADNDNHASGMQ